MNTHVKDGILKSERIKKLALRFMYITTFAMRFLVLS